MHSINQRRQCANWECKWLLNLDGESRMWYISHYCNNKTISTGQNKENADTPSTNASTFSFTFIHLFILYTRKVQIKSIIQIENAFRIQNIKSPTVAIDSGTCQLNSAARFELNACSCAVQPQFSYRPNPIEVGMADRKKQSSDHRRLFNELHIDMHFMSNFDPAVSTRNARKYDNYAFDARGKYRVSGIDACDCLDNTCPGCHFPCPKCKSPKCGVDCRSNRKNAIQNIEIDGGDNVTYNPNIKQTKWCRFFTLGF